MDFNLGNAFHKNYDVIFWNFKTKKVFMFQHSTHYACFYFTKHLGQQNWTTVFAPTYSVRNVWS